FVFALTFIVPLLLCTLQTAILVSIAWGLSMLGIFSYFMARKQNTNPWKAVAEHLIIALVVICLTHYAGDWIAKVFV
ncbi:MAG: hypothetical protein KAI03_03485, partial [Candidatus Aureabacteria bacterium]|nr:hypothetical protein [Candidatus Auribacterota bacterium]